MHPASSKGKAREDAHWQLGWWELYSLVDGPRRPLAWSSSSIIYTAHPTQPQVIARHFPSSRQFFLPLPQPIAASPASYEPPTVITVSPADDWLFAFVPSREGPGIGCLWKRGHQIDSWTPRDYWSFAKGAGVVCAEWMYMERPWVVGETGAPYRLPPRGPTAPMSSPTLLLVTETHFLHACLLPPTYRSMMIVRLALLQSSVASQGVFPSSKPPQNGQSQQTKAETEKIEAEKIKSLNSEDIPPSENGARRVCVHAAIGFGYGESHFTVAMRSKYLPSQDFPSLSEAMDFDGIGMDLGSDMGQQASMESASANDVPTDWEQWGEHSTIDITMVFFEFNGSLTKLHGRPLPPIFSPGSQLTNLQFFAVPPEMPLPSPAVTRDPRRSTKEKEVAAAEKGVLYLAASFLDFDDYSALPKSEVSLYSIGPSAMNQWVTRHEKTRTFDHGALAFLVPGSSRGTVLAGFLDTAGHTPRESAKPSEVSIGSVTVLKLPDLTNDDRWDHSRLLSSADGIGRDIPIGIALSQNHALLCSTSPSSAASSYRLSIHPLPHRHQAPTQLRSDLSCILAQAIFTRMSPSDVIHALTNNSVPLETVTSTLLSAASVLEVNPVGLSELWIDEILGVATEVYLTRAKSNRNEAEQDALTEHWKTAHDICSVRALSSAFEDCKGINNTYDLDIIWQLIGQTSWLVGLLERILKQCIFVAEGRPSPKPYQLDDDDVDPLSWADASVLLHLIHPYALKNLMTAVIHVRKFYEQINQEVPKTENAQLAKDALVDIFDSSGVVIGGLTPLLEEFQKGVAQASAEELRRGLVSCAITAALRPTARQVIDKILASQVIHRPRLFIKPTELHVSLAKVTVSERLWNTNEDVVSKGMLLQRPGGVSVVCVRCGGKSEIIGDNLRRAATKVAHCWRAWEAMWSTRCVCGGAWARSFNTM
ncbi:hypothetical protein BC835DRAFT_1367462 [Cytidiella melzeri]|nr:hypothetical protein BC835DRAFT_1367462 [Cytidiella melzeri]